MKDKRGCLVLAVLNCACLAGFVGLVYGVWMMYEPLAWVLGGIIVVGVAVLLHMNYEAKE